MAKLYRIFSGLCKSGTDTQRGGAPTTQSGCGRLPHGLLLLNNEWHLDIVVDIEL